MARIRDSQILDLKKYTETLQEKRKTKCKATHAWVVIIIFHIIVVYELTLKSNLANQGVHVIDTAQSQGTIVPIAFSCVLIPCRVSVWDKCT